MGDAWNSRQVWFTLFPKTQRLSEELDQGLDLLADYFYEDWRQFLLAGVVSSRDRTLIVSGFKWWIPARLALWLVVRIMEEANIGGNAIFVRERTFLSKDERVVP